jgi:hypothetical protein
MLYPELFSATPGSGPRSPVTITMALNADGSVQASSRAPGIDAANAPRDAVAAISATLGIAPDELASAGVIAPLDRVAIIYGIRRPQRGAAPVNARTDTSP